MQLDEFELLSNDPIYVKDVGSIKIPQLKDIRKIEYKTYETLCNYLAIDLNKYLEIKKLKEQYDMLNDDEIAFNTLYNLIIHSDDFGEIYMLIFSFFIGDNFKFNVDTESFEFYKIEHYEDIVNENHHSDESKIVRFFRLLFKKIDVAHLFNHKSDITIVEKKINKEKQILTGIINNDNFDLVRDILLQVNRLKAKEIDEEQPKYKNEMARKLAERMAKAEKSKQKASQNNMSFGKMISKYCADNKNGINLLNVWDMTIYQFYDQFMQHNHIRQSDIQDMVYANTVSFSDLKSYDSQLWLK